MLLLCLGCGSVMMDEDGDAEDEGGGAEEDFSQDEQSVDAGPEDVALDDAADYNQDAPEESDEFAGDESPDATDDIADDSGSADIPYGDTGPVCNPEWCYATCLASGFSRGECLPGWACNCTRGTYCYGPFRGSAPYGRYVAYNVGISLGTVCRVSTCGEFTGDTYFLIASGWNGENDNACGLGSEITAGPMTATPALTVYVSCLSEECSWAITVDCTPDCTAY